MLGGFKQFFGNTDEMVFMLSLDGKFLDVVYPEPSDLLTLPENILGKHYSDVLPPNISDSIQKGYTVFNSGSKNHTFKYALQIGGENKSFHARMWPVDDKNGKNESIVASVRNITSEEVFLDRLRSNENMLSAIANATRELVENQNTLKAISEGLKLLGEATGVDRVYLFENGYSEEMGEQVTSQRYEWNSGAAEPQIDNPDLQNVPFSALNDFIKPIKEKGLLNTLIKDIPDGELKEMLAVQDIVSILIVPIFIGSEFWGFVGYDDCHREKVWSEAELSLLRSFSGSIASAIVRNRVEQDLITARDHAEKASMAKSEFISNLSHEIRTPLNGVIGYSQLLRDMRLGEEADLFVKSLSFSAEALFDLINDILDFSKIESGKIELKPEVVSISKIAEELHNIVDFSFLKKSNELKITISPDVPDRIKVDQIRLKQILINLISNANKFMNNGTVKLMINKTPEGLYFGVLDQGIGIREEDFSKLFQPFSQLDSSLSKKYSGTGLGLSIVKRLLNAMHTEPKVKSEFGKWSLFSFVLPWDEIDFEEEFREEKLGSKTIHPKQGLTVLVVEDNEVNMMLTKHMLLKILADAQIIECENGHYALDYLKNNKMPDIVFLDLEMPDFDGFDTMKSMQETHKDLCPVIALTATASADVRERCLSMGMSDFISKPCRIHDLRNSVSKFLD